MKEYYEFRSQTSLARRMPVVMRIDGKAFHTLTKRLHLNRPFDEDFAIWMEETARRLCEEIQGAKLAYVQSDEISILLVDYDTLNTESWFDYNIQKMTSVSSGIASSFFTSLMRHVHTENDLYGIFDSRVFNIPREDANNYFVWRQQDWTKNSVQMLAREYYSHKELHGKNRSDMHEMLYEKGVNWADLDDKWKNGVTLIREVFDTSDGGESERIRSNWDAVPNIIFTKERWIVGNLVQECVGPATAGA
jgi:tRNA(His) 5'-end guanylyltransferase